MDPRQRRQGPINSLPSVRSSGSYKFTPVRPFVRPGTFLGIRSLVFSETLAQVRGPGVEKVTKPEFWTKLHIWLFWPKNGPISDFLPISRNFVITFGCNLCQNVLRMVTNLIAPFVFLGKNLFLAFFGEKRSRPSRSLDFEMAISREPQGRFF